MNYIKILILLLFAILVFTFEILANESGPVTLAVLEFEYHSDDPKLDPFRKGFRDMLRTDLSSIPNVYIVERNRLSDILKEFELTEEKYFDPKTVAKIGYGVGANTVLTGSYIRFKDQVRIDARLISVETGTQIFAQEVKGARIDIFDLEKELAEAIAKKLVLKIGRKKLWQLRQFHTRNIEAFKLYSKAAEARDEGRLDEAKKGLRLAIAKDPYFGLAENTLSAIEQEAAALLKKTRTGKIKEYRKITELLEQHKHHHEAILKESRFDPEYFAALLVLSAHTGLVDDHNLEREFLKRFWDEITDHIFQKNLLSFLDGLSESLKVDEKFFEDHIDSGIYGKNSGGYIHRLVKDRNSTVNYLTKNQSLFLKPELKEKYHWPRYSQIWPFNPDLRLIKARQLFSIDKMSETSQILNIDSTPDQVRQLSNYYENEIVFNKPRYPHEYLQRLIDEIKQDEKYPDKYLVPRYPETLEFYFSITEYYSALPDIQKDLKKSLDEIYFFIVEVLWNNNPLNYSQTFSEKAVPVLRFLAKIGSDSAQRERANKILLKFIRHLKILKNDMGSEAKSIFK